MPYFDGGFIGVDIFFVISGYLITSILIKDIENNTFSIKNFYEKRIRRIFPALFFVIFISLPIAYLIFLPDKLILYAQSIATASLFVSNIFFGMTNGFFDGVSEEKPFLHTWSLGIEEQFYIIFPLVLWLFRKNLKIITYLIIMTILFSIAIAEWSWRKYPDAAFFFTPTRVWELMTGALCSFIVFHNNKKNTRIEQNNILSLIGLACIIPSFIFFNDKIPAPSLYLVPCIVGSSLVLLYSGDKTVTGKLLSAPPLYMIGLISYSVYLWHQPLFAFSHILTYEDLSTSLSLVLSVASLGIGYLSWRFIETPFRNTDRFSQKQIFSSAFFVITFTLIISVWIILTKGFPERVTKSGISYTELSQTLAPNRGLDDVCNDSFEFLRPECKIEGSPMIALWGDSYAMHLADFIQADNPGYGLVQITKSNCAPIPSIHAITSKTFIKSRAYDCLDFNARALEWIINNPDIRYVVIGSAMGVLEDNQKAFLTPDGIVQYSLALAKQNLSLAIHDLIKHDKKVIFISPPPRDDRDIGKCLANAHLFHRNNTQHCNIKQKDDEFYNRVVLNFYRWLDKKHNVIWLHDSLCKNGVCYTSKDNVLIYRDKGHLSREGSRWLGHQLELLE